MAAEIWQGRGAGMNPAGRFESATREAFEDADSGEEIAPAPSLPKSEYLPEAARTIVQRNHSPDLPFSLSINPYRGCEHGCSYCYARPYHAYAGLSSGLDFERRIFYKAEAAALLRAYFRKSNYQPETIAIAGVTDPYQPLEARERITRSLLEVFLEHGHPLSLITKNALIQRDIDLLAPLAQKGLLRVFLSVTSLDATLSRDLEPRASSPRRRLNAIAALSAAGIPVGVMVAPLIPGLNDTELESILAAARQKGARYAGYILLRLPHELRALFDDWLTRKRPLQRDRIWRLIESTRKGQRNETRWGLRMRGAGPLAEMYGARFRKSVSALGFKAPPALRCDLFRAPRTAQLGLFDDL